ncbi:hypothetical protein PR002_g363 [Phytophthora rubi]|nr:hypothetical protein PR002_g363 [Phytophthora rubi]
MPTRDEGDDEGTRVNETPVEASQLHTETTTRDDWRAKRYVETVRPVIAALRYDPEIDDEERYGRRRATEDGGEPVMRKEVLATEEGAVPATTSTPATTAAATVPRTTTAVSEATLANATMPAPAVQCSMELGGWLVPHRDDVGWSGSRRSVRPSGSAWSEPNNA